MLNNSRKNNKQNFFQLFDVKKSFFSKILFNESFLIPPSLSKKNAANWQQLVNQFLMSLFAIFVRKKKDNK